MVRNSRNLAYVLILYRFHLRYHSCLLPHQLTPHFRFLTSGLSKIMASLTLLIRGVVDYFGKNKTFRHLMSRIVVPAELRPQNIALWGTLAGQMRKYWRNWLDWVIVISTWTSLRLSRRTWYWHSVMTFVDPVLIRRS